MAKKIDLNGLDHFKEKENAMIASEYSSSKTYAVGDYVYYAGTLYVCTTAITTAEAWTAGHWTAAKLADDCSALKTAINAFENRFIASKATDGYALNYTYGTLSVLSAGFVTDFIPVSYGETVEVPNLLNSTSYAHVFFANDRKTIIAKYYANAANTKMVVPQGAEYFRASGYLPKKSDMYVKVSGYGDFLYEIRDNKYILNWAEQDDNLFSGYTSGKARLVANGLPDTVSGWYYSDPIAVEPQTFYKVNVGVKTTSYGHVFFDNDYNVIAAYDATGDFLETGYKIMLAPVGATMLSISGLLSDVTNQSVTKLNFQTTDKIISMVNDINREDVYKRKVLKYPKIEIDGFSHEAFPSACFWGNNIVTMTRLSKSHTAPSDSADWGGIHVRLCDDNGKWVDGGLYTKSDFTGLNGELRDPQIQPSRDGEHLICAAWTTYKNNDVDVHDNLLVLFDKDMNVENYLVSPLTSALYWGNPLITPDGHLIICGYLNGSTVLLRSAEVFNGDVSALTMETAVTLVSGLSTTEACVGYSDDKLYCLIRRDTDSSKMMWTSNLEGTSGWSEPKNLGMLLHAPKLLPYASGRYIPFGGALYKSSSLRNPIMGYIDTQENEIASYGIVDESIINYSSYLGFVPFGGTDFGVVYYQDTGSGLTGTGLYYKRYNARFNQGKLAYLL